MAYWTILGKVNSGSAKSFGVTLDTSTTRWLASGPGVNEVFKTKSGPYVIKPAPELGTFLMKSGSNEVVAVFRNLHGGSAAGATGNGRQHETALTFDWRLESL